MISENKQINFWSGSFGKEYTMRNTTDESAWNAVHLDTWGVTKSEMYGQFIGHLNRGIRILEVGCNTGMQLLCLQKMGFTELFGIEIQHFAIELAKQHTKEINIIHGSGLDIPFKDGFFDLVFTSGVLIHIHPDQLKDVMSEVIRCSRKYILGFEYYADTHRPITYRGNDNVLWKGDFCRYYTELFPDLKITKKVYYKYLKNENVDLMYLLEK